jgi:hypothetical protein
LRLAINLLLLLCFLFATREPLAQVSLSSSNLPILLVDTDGAAIPDEPKIVARLRAIDNGPGQRNSISDPANSYDGDVGIELRGSSSLALFDKKSYAVETRLPDGSNNNVPLLGLPLENDWVLHGPYSDKSLIRNALTYELYRLMGRYASRARFCELVINGQYQGIYVLLERVKRDNDRIDISRLRPEDVSGDQLTGGYIIKVDKLDGAEIGGWYSNYPTMTDPGRMTYYQFHYPRPSEIVPEQEEYIRTFMDNFEATMASEEFADPQRGYRALFDDDAAVDYILINEVGGNVDAYRLSTFLYKDRDSVDVRLVVGPPWDYNIAWGNANYYDGDRVQGFRIRYPLTRNDGFHGPFWWRRLLDDGAFVSEVAARWRDLRASVLSGDAISAVIDSLAGLLGEGQARNFGRWPILGEWIWPNAVVTGSFGSELNYLRSWIAGRLNWLDDNIETIGGRPTTGDSVPDAPRPALSLVHPNPATSWIEFEVSLSSSQRVRISLVDTRGRTVKSIHSSFLPSNQLHPFAVRVGDVASGVYFLRLEGDRVSATKKVAIVSDGS